MTTLSSESEDILARVSQNDLLVRTILDNLSVKQLDSVRVVCHRFSLIAGGLIKYRVYYDTFLLIYDSKGFRLSSSGRLIAGDEDGTDKKLFLDSLIRSKDVAKCAREDSSINQVVAYFEEKLWSLPALGILFTSSVTFAKKMALETYLPTRSQQLIICSKAGIVGQPSLRSKPIELEKYHFKLSAIAGAFVARSWGEFKVVLTNWNNIDDPGPDPNDADYPVKCSIIFSINFEDGVRFNSWLSASSYPIPVAGALVDKILYEEEEVNMLTVSFVGKNIKAASFVLETKTLQEAETELLKFKRSLDFDPDDLDEKVRTIGYLFICAGRGAEFYHGHLNVESNLVHKVFPQVMFSGVFGNGEYGWNCYDYPQRDKLFKTLSQSTLALSYTTSIVLIQFNRVKRHSSNVPQTK